PYRKHPAYDRLAEDWMALLRLGLPARDAYGHLVPLGAFHVLLYQMETAAAWAGHAQPPPYVCEVNAPKREFVRERAIRCFLDNDGLCRIALEAFVNETMSGGDWESAVNNPTLVTDAERVHEAIQYLSKSLWLDEKDLAGCADLNDVRAAALARLHDKLDDN